MRLRNRNPESPDRPDPRRRTDLRRVYWWHDPVSLERSPAAGRKMFVAILVWLLSLTALAIIVGLVFAAAG